MSRSHAVLLCIFWVLCASEDAKWFKWRIRVCVCVCVCSHMCSLTSDCDALDCNPPGCSLHRIFLDNPEYWSRLPFPHLGDLPDPGIEPLSRISSIGKQILTTAPLGEPIHCQDVYLFAPFSRLHLGYPENVKFALWCDGTQGKVFFFFNENMVFVYIILSQWLFRVRSS